MWQNGFCGLEGSFLGQLTGVQFIDSSKADGQPTVSRQSTDALSGSKQDYAAQKAEAAARRKKEKQIAETEEAIAQLEAQQAEIEQQLALPENQTAEMFQKYENIKHQIEQKMYEWEILSDE